MKNKIQKQKGFTLIELLVVIAILGLLASTILVAINDQRIRARDNNRISNLKSLQHGLELYYSDHGSYPAVSTSIFPHQFAMSDTYYNGQYQDHIFSGAWDDLQAALRPYMVLPEDRYKPYTYINGIRSRPGFLDGVCLGPMNPASVNNYRMGSIHKGYWLGVELENPTDSRDETDGGVTHYIYELYGGDLRFYNGSIQLPPQCSDLDISLYE